MQINIAELLGTSDAFIKLRFDFLPTVKLPKDIKLTEAFKFNGSLTHNKGTFILVGNTTSSLEVCCARCLKETIVPFECEVSEKFSTQSSTDDEFIFFEGGFIDLTDAINENILLNLPLKVLCSPDCKGLCEVCGIDLNVSTCQCKDNVVNVFSKLSDYFKTN